MNTSASNTPLTVDYYSDVLCIWAWIAQRRIDELNQQLSKRIEIHYHYMDVFGDVDGKMNRQWKDRGGFCGFAEHVRHSSEDFEHAQVHPDIWTKVRPKSSAPAHLMIKAIESACGVDASIDYALQLRRAFFCNAQNIGDWDILKTLAHNNGLDFNAIEIELNNGTAMAKLMADYQQAKTEGLKGSPSYVLDNGRQILFGNVGYRILCANIEELLRNPTDEASWC
ncbi:hypothetical protein MAH1_31130 [Sessilibacter sp. MAH1]